MKSKRTIRSLEPEMRLMEEFCLPGEPPARQYLAARLNRHPKTLQRMERLFRERLNTYKIAWNYQLVNHANELSAYQLYCLILAARFFVNHRGEISWINLKAALGAADPRFRHSTFKKIMEGLN